MFHVSILLALALLSDYNCFLSFWELLVWLNNFILLIAATFFVDDETDCIILIVFTTLLTNYLFLFFKHLNLLTKLSLSLFDFIQPKLRSSYTAVVSSGSGVREVVLLLVNCFGIFVNILCILIICVYINVFLILSYRNKLLVVVLILLLLCNDNII